MPELPEVQTVVNGLQKLVGQKITKIITRFPRLRYPLNSKELNQCSGHIIQKIERRAKYIIITTDAGNLICHLGMSGKITIYETPPEITKHDHVDIVTEHFTVRYNDPRRFGCVIFSDDITKLEMLNTLGPEPLTDIFTGKYLFEQIKSRKTTIKQLIMDNAIVVGVGNIYACESLFLSHISPLRTGNQLKLKECEKLVSNVKEVLQHAIALGGSSLRDYRNADGDLGYFQQNHFVYGHANKPCKICNSIIQEIRLGQRNSFYCPTCQK
ncbi:MAG: bifunctional DNA-formamidopyrimidine glycosylase/DNA-(apurinic or apyrimidinic site) lyase [Neisseriaceae bacterium]|nr:MAG: bifunctional DNA-formamidopyrimidine glycosylase/DNA-(apurinic or apyrimidinic site) lyase [Neisseriaceae bacterium]